MPLLLSFASVTVPLARINRSPYIEKIVFFPEACAA
jgi:hypothetical protein